MNPTTHYGPRNVSIPVPEGGLYVDKFVANQEFLDNPAEAIRGKMWRKVDGALPTIIETPEGPQLAKVIDDRHGEEFRVPQEHIEKLITNLSPTHVGDLFLSFTEKILSEAQELR